MARKKPIDNVTTERLQSVLKMCNIDLPKDTLDKIIDIVELIEVKSGETSLDDIDKLKDLWSENDNKFNHFHDALRYRIHVFNCRNSVKIV